MKKLIAAISTLMLMSFAWAQSSATESNTDGSTQGNEVTQSSTVAEDSNKDDSSAQSSAAGDDAKNEEAPQEEAVAGDNKPTM